MALSASLIEDVAGGPGLVGWYLKCVLTPEPFTISRDWLTLLGAVPPGSVRFQSIQNPWWISLSYETRLESDNVALKLFGVPEPQGPAYPVRGSNLSNEGGPHRDPMTQK